MRILVTGAGGQVGAEIAHVATQHEVVALTRRDCDLADARSIATSVAAVAPDVIINCAAATNVDGCETAVDEAFAVNGVGVGFLARAASQINAHVVHVSTDYVFDGTKRSPYEEADPTGPRSVYGQSKLAGELELAANSSSWTLVRTSWVFGRRGRNFVDTIVDKARAGDPLRVVDDQFGSPTYAPDLAGMLVRLGVERRPGVFHVTNQGSCSWHAFAVAALESAGVAGVLVGRMSSAELDRPAPRPANSILANRALRVAGIPLLRHYREALHEKFELAQAA